MMKLFCSSDVTRNAAIIASCVSILGLTGCALSPVSSQPSATPPKLVPVSGVARLTDDKYTWDRPNAFGPMPENLKALGDSACLQSRPDLEALGYHPGALDENAVPMPGGGFYCGVKLNGSRPDLWPPQLVETNGVLAWDRPRAFGAVPESLQQKADSICAQARANYRAAGYHPWAKDRNGQPIPGGGFFCAPPKAVKK